MFRAPFQSFENNFLPYIYIYIYIYMSVSACMYVCVLCMWYVCGMYLVCVVYVCGMYVVCIWNVCGMYVYVCGMCCICLQVFAAQGFAVLAINFHGSTGYVQTSSCMCICTCFILCM